MSETAWNEGSKNIPNPDHENRVERRKQMARSLARGGMDGVQVLSHESAERVLTPKRRELIAVLTEETVESVRDLARRVERDKGQVSRDLKVLAEQGVVDFEKTGRSKRPYLQHDHLVVEPIY